MLGQGRHCSILPQCITGKVISDRDPPERKCTRRTDCNYCERFANEQSGILHHYYIFAFFVYGHLIWGEVRKPVDARSGKMLLIMQLPCRVKQLKRKMTPSSNQTTKTCLDIKAGTFVRFAARPSWETGC